MALLAIVAVVLAIVAVSAIGWVVVGIPGVLFAVLGVVAYILTPILIGALGRVSLGTFYGRLAMLAMDSAVLVHREKGGYSIHIPWWDGEDNTMKYALAGEEKPFRDPRGKMSYLYERSFGIINDGTSVIRTPFEAEVGEHLDLLIEGAKDKITIADKTLIAKFVDLPRQMAVVDPAMFSRAMGGNSSPDLEDKSYKYTVISQEKYKGKPSLLGLGAVLVQFIATFLFVAFIGDYFIGGGGDGSRATNVTETILPGLVDALVVVI